MTRCLNDWCESEDVDIVHVGTKTHISCNDCNYLHRDVML